MTRLLRVTAFLMLPVMVIGVIECADAIVCLYMVEVAGAIPGQPMYVDDLAPTPTEALEELAVGLIIIIVAITTRWAIHRKFVRRSEAAK